MNKKQSFIKSRNPSAQHRKAKAKAPGFVQAGVDATEGQSIRSNEDTLPGDSQGLSGMKTQLLRALRNQRKKCLRTTCLPDIPITITNNKAERYF